MQFGTLTYQIKLCIELNIAELIAKIVKAENPIGSYIDEEDRSRRASDFTSVRMGASFSGASSQYTGRREDSKRNVPSIGSEVCPSGSRARDTDADREGQDQILLKRSDV